MSDHTVPAPIAVIRSDENTSTEAGYSIMPTIDESVSAVSQGNSDVIGIQLISLDQEIAFTQYTRYVLPLDGYVFWLKTQTMMVKGSLHATVAKQQNEDESPGVDSVVFTTGMKVQEFNAIQPDTMWVGSTGPIRFAFSRSDDFFVASGIYHYSGIAVYPALENMLVDTGDQLSVSTLVVSNSLPLWLSLVGYNPVWLQPPNPGITLYPSFLVPANLRPPYGTVHIEPGSTRGIAAAPSLGPVRPIGSGVLGVPRGTTPDSSHNQLTADRVRVTLYGLTNAQALDFHDLVNQYSYDLDLMGIMNIPIMVDEKRTQPEVGVLAMKKSIIFEVSYYQNRANAAARQLIEKAAATIYVQ